LFGEDYEKKMSQYRDALREWNKQNGAHQEVLRKIKENPTEIDPEKMQKLRYALKNIAANDTNQLDKGYNMFLVIGIILSLLETKNELKSKGKRTFLIIFFLITVSLIYIYKEKIPSIMNIIIKIKEVLNG
jgi:hypothetical protein